MAQSPQTPNVDAQRIAIQKLGFLIGEWSGEAVVARGPGIVIELEQTEVAELGERPPQKLLELVVRR